ncbi:MAG: response regulator transcription factor [Saprospiraceae bacterium]|jgi:DNA-binding LytR/AlgR family response regulator|nr:response regulator transcription factor [Saprospiraceae bacterium]MBL0293963.1 response regulator transcription factor [Saprospiraceae bacterium]
MNKIKVMLVDDEPLALEILETYLQQLSDVEHVVSCSNALEARDFLKTNEIDVIFTDIQMPQVSGLDFIKTLAIKPLVVFTTAYPNFAAEGFDLDAIDYLLKPISQDRFLKSIGKIREKLQLKQPKASEEEYDYIFVKADKKFIKVKYQDIIYIEGLKDYVIIRLDSGRIITLQTMKSLEDKLPPEKFIRIHRSFILATDKILAINGNMVEIKEKNETKLIPIGKNYRDEVDKIISDNKL